MPTTQTVAPARVLALAGLEGPLVLERVRETMASYGGRYYGQPGRWRDVLTDAQARAICAALDEPLPE